MFDPKDPLSAIRWLPVKNASGETVPSYGVMKVTGYEDDTGAFTVGKPDADGISTALLLVNGPGPIADGQYGSATADFPVLAGVASGSAGDQAGTAAGTWTLDNTKTGFYLWKSVSASLAVVKAAAGGGGGSEKLFRVTSFFLQDTNPPVASPSPHCFYPVVEQVPTAAAGFPADGTFLAWWISPYSGAYSIFPPVGVPGAPTTIVKADGSAYVTGIPAGFSYAPQNAGTPAHPNNGQLRPVYMDARYASGWAAQCDPVTGLWTLLLGDG